MGKTDGLIPATLVVAGTRAKRPVIRQTHWENIYGKKAADAVSWYRRTLKPP